VHGTFALKRGTLRFDPATGKAAGEIVVDALSGQSGNDSRDNKMHKEVLENARFTDIVFRPDRVEVSSNHRAARARSFTAFACCMAANISASVRAELNSDQWKGTVDFNVPYNDWGLKNPGNFLLKVDHTMSIEVQMAGSIQAPQ